MWSPDFLRFMGFLNKYGVDFVMEVGVVRVTILGYPNKTIVSVATTTIESDPDEAREMVETAVTLMNLFE